jgi:hypothetical protein
VAGGGHHAPFGKNIERGPQRATESRPREGSVETGTVVASWGRFESFSARFRNASVETVVSGVLNAMKLGLMQAQVDD